MIGAYVDTSVVAAALLEEADSALAAEALKGSVPLYSSNLLEAELLAAARGKGVSAESVHDALRAMNWVYPSRRLTQEYSRVLAAGPIRGADLLHLACALYLSPDPKQFSFLTLDTRQAAIARALGFTVEPR